MGGKFVLNRLVHLFHNPSCTSFTNFIFTSLSILGTKLIPSDFLAPVWSHNPMAGGSHHKVMCLVTVFIMEYIFESLFMSARNYEIPLE